MSKGTGVCADTSAEDVINIEITETHLMIATPSSHPELGEKGKSRTGGRIGVTIAGNPAPVGIERPGVEKVSGVVSKENGVGAGDGFSGEHAEAGCVIANGDTPGSGDLLEAGADFNKGPAIVVSQELGVALGVDGGEGRADDGIAIGINLEDGFEGPAFG